MTMPCEERSASDPIRLATPLDEGMRRNLQCGDPVLLSGTIFTARDAAHRRMVEAYHRGEPLPFDLRGQVIYYTGPSPTPPGAVVGALGPTTSGRMDPYTPLLLELGLRGMIGKGRRSAEVVRCMEQFGAVYFGATGGAAALLARAVRRVRPVAYEDLGPEAITALEVEDFPVTVVVDTRGHDLYAEGPAAYLERQRDLRPGA